MHEGGKTKALVWVLESREADPSDYDSIKQAVIVK